MKYLFTMIIVGLLFHGTSSFAQTPSAKPKYVRFRTQTDSLKKQLDELPLTNNRIIADSLYDKKLDSTLSLVSGFAYKDGKATRTSAVVDDKSITANINLYDGYYNTFQLTAGAASEEKFAEIFKDGSYNKSLNIGINYILFLPWSRSWTDSDIKERLKDKINATKNYFELLHEVENPAQKLSDLIDFYNKNNSLLDQLKRSNSNDVALFKNMEQIKKIEAMFKDQFSKFSHLDQTERQNAINEIISSRQEIISNYQQQRTLDSLNNLQLQQKFNATTFWWISANAKYNNAKNQVFNPAGLAKDNFLTDVYDNFLSAAVSGNFLWKNKWTNVYVSPSLGASFNTYNFKSDDLKTANIPKGQQTVNNPANTPASQTITEYKQITYYPSTPNRVTRWTYQIPVIVYINKWKFGIDLAYTRTFADVVTKSEGRIGIFIPFGIGESTVNIEPLLRFEDLWTNSTDPLFKKRTTIGISAAFSLPKFMGK